MARLEIARRRGSIELHFIKIGESLFISASFVLVRILCPGRRRGHGGEGGVQRGEWDSPAPQVQGPQLCVDVCAPPGADGLLICQFIPSRESFLDNRWALVFVKCSRLAFPEMAFNIFPSILRFVEPNSALPLPGGRR